MNKFILKTMAALISCTPVFAFCAEEVEAGTQESAYKMALEIDLAKFSNKDYYQVNSNVDISACINSNVRGYKKNTALRKTITTVYINKNKGLQEEHVNKAINQIANYWCYISAIPGQGNKLEFSNDVLHSRNAEVTHSGATVGLNFLAELAYEIMDSERSPNQTYTKTLETIVFILAHEVGHSVLDHIDKRNKYRVFHPQEMLSGSGAVAGAGVGATIGAMTNASFEGMATGAAAGAIAGAFMGRTKGICDYWDEWVMHEYEADLWALNKLLQLWKAFDTIEYANIKKNKELRESGQITWQEEMERNKEKANPYKIPGMYAISFFEYQKEYNLHESTETCREALKRIKPIQENVEFLNKTNPHPNKSMRLIVARRFNENMLSFGNNK